MRKVICDRCGSEITSDNEIEYVFDHELCPNCVELLKKWLVNPDNYDPHDLVMNIDTTDCADRNKRLKEEWALRLILRKCSGKCYDCSHFTRKSNPFNPYDTKGIYLCELANIYISGNCSRPDAYDMTPADFCKLGTDYIKDKRGEQ